MIVQAEVDAAFRGGSHLFAEVDRVFDHPLRCDRALAIGERARLAVIYELPIVDVGPLRSHLDLVANKLDQSLGGDLLVLQAAHFGQEFFGGMLMSGCSSPTVINLQQVPLRADGPSEICLRRER